VVIFLKDSGIDLEEIQAKNSKIGYLKR